MKRMIAGCVALGGVLFVALPLGAEQGRGQSIMFGNEKSPLTHAPTRPDERSARCRELQKRVQEMQGKPQRKFAALQQYEAECTSDRGL